jgi:hypothetical protein
LSTAALTARDGRKKIIAFLTFSRDFLSVENVFRAKIFFNIFFNE